jgi:hypothetical protein
MVIRGVTDIMNAWGILGNPTPEQIESWKNLPHGKFKSMVDSVKKKAKGKTLRRHAVEIKKTSATSVCSFVYVQAFDYEHAITQAREINKSDLDWFTAKPEPEKISYRVSQVW